MSKSREEQSLEAQLRMKQDDWIETCKEIEALESALAVAVKALKACMCDPSGEHECINVKALAEIEKIRGEK